MGNIASIAIETSSRNGGVALGLGDEFLGEMSLGPSGRHAAELLARMDELLKTHQMKPEDLGELYVSVGPGSFTGLRVGITVARTLGHILPAVKIVAVSTAAVIAEGFIAQLEKSDKDKKGYKNLGVVLAAKRATAGKKECSVHGTLFDMGDCKGPAVQVGESVLSEPSELLANWPEPIVLTGEGLEYAGITEQAEGVSAIVSEELRLPLVKNVWLLGRRLASRGEFTSHTQLVPIYARQPEALRLWAARGGGDKKAPKG